MGLIGNPIAGCGIDLPGRRREFKPLVGAVLSSVNNMTNKVGTLAQGNPAVSGGINAMKMAASAMGIDTAAPCGAFVTTDKDGQAVSCTFLPISKVEAYVAVLEEGADSRVP